jgi:membrane-associated phospholipid phosphatase
VPDLALRMRRLFLLKLVGTSGLVGLFFIAYFAVLRDPGRPAFPMPLTALDHALPFQPALLYAYLSLWLYVGTAPGLLLTLRELLAYALWASGLAAAGLALFHFWPTVVPTLTMDVSDIAGFRLLQGVDAPGNACPSMHVAFAVLSFAWIHRILTQARAPGLLRGLNLLWFLAIAWSTLAIRQHVVLDVVAGALLGALFAALSLRFSRPK